MKHLFLVLLFFLAGNLISKAQNDKLDSLIAAEKAYLNEDSKHLAMLSEISQQLLRNDPQRCITYCYETIHLASKLNNSKVMADTYNTLGKSFFSLGMSDSSIAAFNKSLASYEVIHDSAGMGNIYNNLGNVYLMNLSDFSNAASYLKQAIRIQEAIGRKDLLIGPNKNLGIIYTLWGDYRNAQAALLKSAEYAEAYNRKNLLSGIYMELGNVYNYLEDLNKAREYYQKSLDMSPASDIQAKAQNFENIALTYQNESPPEKAFKYHLEAYDIFRKANNVSGLSFTLTNMGHMLNCMYDTTFQRLQESDYFSSISSGETNQYELAQNCFRKSIAFQPSGSKNAITIYNLNLLGESFLKMGKFLEAKGYTRESMRLADSLQLLDKQKDALKVMSRIYEASGRFDSAYYYYKEYIRIRDTIDNKAVHGQLMRKEAEYEYSIKEKDILHQKELSDVAAASANTELQRQLLLAHIREQELLLMDRALEIGRKDKEMEHLAYLKKMAELDLVKLDKQDKEKQLSLTKQNLTLQNLKLGKRELERNLLIVGAALSLLSIFLIFRNYRNQRKANLKQQELNTVISGVNEELNLKNSELANTLDNLKQTQAQLVETEKMKETEVIRRRISQDIHDDISSGLTRIAWLSELAKEKASQGLQEDAASALQKIVASSRETVDRLGEIIWAINPDRDNLEGFFAYLRTYVVRFFEDTPFKVTLDFPEKKPDLKFNPELKRTLFLVVKEALHNIAKHSQAKKIAVSFQCPDHRYNIIITDDGKGFEIDTMELKGNGLKNMEKRMESVGGKIEIESKPQEGTVVILSGEVYN
jgi:signal transduction histidine kinase